MGEAEVVSRYFEKLGTALRKSYQKGRLRPPSPSFTPHKDQTDRRPEQQGQNQKLQTTRIERVTFR